MTLRAGVAAALALLCFAASAQPAPRSSSELRAFKRANPCPATGERRGACPGYVVDHVEPLCAAGPDRVENMQWQTVAEAKVKDRWEVRECRTRQRVKTSGLPP